MLPEKAHAVCLLKILSEYSDRNHILPMREIIAKMESDYSVRPDRRTIYSSVSVLVDLGFDISTYEDNGIGYYLKQRLLETSEIHLLIDAACSCSCLSEKHTSDLIAKLQKTMSVYERKRLAQFSIKRPGKKAVNPQVFWNIEQLEEAISKNVKVSFTYMQYSLNKTLVPRRKERYTVNPYGLVFDNERYYLVCIKDDKEAVSMYRIDRMKDIILSKSSLDPQKPGFDPKRSIEKAIYAYTGEPELIVMHCKSSILDHIIDKFGTDIQIRERDSENLEVCLNIPPNGVKFWALQFLPYPEP